MNVPDFLMGILGGGIIGYIVQERRYKYNLKVEKIKRITPSLEQAYPIIQRAKQDFTYGIEIQNRNDINEITNLLPQLSNNLAQFYEWYKQYQENGLKPELKSLDRTLYSYLNGLFVFSRISQTQGESYIHQSIPNICTHLKRCEKSLETFLMS